VNFAAKLWTFGNQLESTKYEREHSMAGGWGNAGFALTIVLVRPIMFDSGAFPLGV